MTEKPFNVNLDFVYDKEGNLYSLQDCCDLLNEQHETIERLKRNFQALDEVKCKLAEENEQLKSKNRGLQSELQIFKEDVTHSNLQINKLFDENEQLKSTIKDVVELLSEEVDVFSDKATKHDINAYVELRELDNKDAYYMAISTKKAIKMLKGDGE